MTDKEIEEYFYNCIEYSNKIKNPILRKCCQEIYSDYKEQLINKPATPGRHHYFKGGLLYHIYCVTRNSYNIASMYKDLNIDIDLVIFGALLHDIGKINEYNNFIEDETYVARRGNGAELLGHSYEGTHIVDNYLEPASMVINTVEKGEMYEFPKANIPYYKSLNPYYNND